MLTNLIFVGTFENNQSSHIHALGTEVPVWTDRQTDRQTDMRKLVATSCNISKTPKHIKRTQKRKPV